jgi:hypothetical protein
MGTVTRGPLKEDPISYTAQARLTRGGRVFFSQAPAFERGKAARVWLERKGNELRKPGALKAARAVKAAVTVAGLIDVFLASSRKAVGTDCGP